MKINQLEDENMKKIIIFLLLLLGIFCFYKINKVQTNKIEHIENKYNLKYWIKNYTYTIINNNDSDHSYSILKNGCNIEININKNIPILMDNKEKDIEFTFLHEFGHCVLGKEALLNKIDWKIEITEKEKQKINNLIKENEQFYVNNSKTPLIKVIYHEIFADTFATILYLQNNNDKDIIYLLKIRKEQNKNPYDTHLSVSSIEEILNNKNIIKNLTIDKIKDKSIEIAQKQLLNYIRVEYE